MADHLCWYGILDRDFLKIYVIGLLWNGLWNILFRFALYVFTVQSEILFYVWLGFCSGRKKFPAGRTVRIEG